MVAHRKGKKERRIWAHMEDMAMLGSSGLCRFILKLDKPLYLWNPLKRLERVVSGVVCESCYLLAGSSHKEALGFTGFGIYAIGRALASKLDSRTTIASLVVFHWPRDCLICPYNCHRSRVHGIYPLTKVNTYPNMSQHLLQEVPILPVKGFLGISKHKEMCRAWARWIMSSTFCHYHLPLWWA